VKLTIAIPTYNRLRQLRTTVQLLLPQLTADVAITILDNASHTPVTLEALQVAPPDQRKVKVLRNRFNIGGVANILRCLEICETDHVWVLGDDDYPSEACIDTIAAAINSAPEAIAFNFSDGSCHRGSQVISHGMDGFIRAIDNWSAVLHLSSNVYNASRMQPFIHAGYDFAYSYAPLVAVLLDTLRVQVGDVLLSPARLVTGNQPGCENPWSAISYILRRYAILDLPMDPQLRLVLGRKITRFAGDLNSPFVYFVSDFRVDHSGTMEDIVNRSYRYLSLLGKFKAILFRILIRFPRLSWFLILKLFPKAKIAAIVNREVKAAPAPPPTP
jgi:glycosyltransferase involved in cell wall biosynthesis